MAREKRMVTNYGGNGSPLKAIGNKGRNEPCICGSGKKAKHCCGTETNYQLTGAALQQKILKLQREQEAIHQAEQEKKSLNDVIHD